jgi:hypothetical protein
MNHSIHKRSDTEKVKPVKKARDALKLLYNSKLNDSKENPNIDNFYPVDLNLLTSLLGWEIDRTEVAGYSNVGHILDAVVNFNKQKISLTDRDDIPIGRLNFSLAHEIGHIILHGEKEYNLIGRTRPFRVRGKNIK